MCSLRALVGNPFAFAADAAYRLGQYRVGDALDSVACRVFNF